MKLKLIKSLAAFTLGLIGFDSAITAAAEYPNKPIRLLVGFPAGQMTDLLTRAVADELSKLLNNPIYVENKPGQGGSIALSQLARSTPDGYTLMLSPPAGLVINPNIYNSINYNTLEDFQPIAQVGEVPFVLIANNEMPFNTVQEFIDYAKERPGELAFISPGNGTLPHLGMVLFQKENNLSLVHVPYKGSPTAVADLAANRVEVGFDTEVVTKPFVNDGKIKILGVTSEKRLDTMPNVPTMKESNEDFNLTAWFAIMAPKDTPEDIVLLLESKLKEATQNESFIEHIRKTGTVANFLPSAMLKQKIANEYHIWHEIVEETGATID